MSPALFLRASVDKPMSKWGSVEMTDVSLSLTLGGSR